MKNLDLFPEELAAAKKAAEQAALCRASIRITRDLFPESPRELDNLGVMLCHHGRYNLGDYDALPPDGPHYALPLYLYDHGGITMNTTGFSCPWDSGQVGIIYVPEERAREECPPAEGESEDEYRERILGYIRGEVEVYDLYLQGEVYSFEIVDENGDTLDSCSGFYGDDWFTNGMSDYIPACLHEKLRTATAE